MSKSKVVSLMVVATASTGAGAPAEGAVAVVGRPWQPRLSPYRVRRGFLRLLCALGSPAAAPKPSGCSPGRPKGCYSGPATRYPAIKKPTKKPRKEPPTTAKAA